MAMYMTQALHRLTQQRPDAPAAVDDVETLSWRALAERTAKVAGLLQSLGLQPGDRVAMLSRNSVDFFAYILGTWWAGGVINPVNLRWSVGEIAFSLRHCESRILIVEAPFATLIPAIREQAPCLRHVLTIGIGESADQPDYRHAVAAAVPVKDTRRGGDDLAAVLYTGGTTGKPKGVMLSHGNLAGSLFGSMAFGRAHERYLHTAPLFHIGALSGLFVALYSDTTSHFLPLFDPEAVLRAIALHAIDELFLVPAMLRMVVDHPDFASYRTASVRRIRYGASPIDAGLMDRALAAFPNAGFFQAYGMTELSPVATVLPEPDHHDRASTRLRSAGKATPTVELRIVDVDRQELPRGAVGEITVRGPGVMLGYWDAPQATAEVLRDGWMHTGDLGRMDADGYVTVVDRLKDMIITGGENVYSAEVETALSTHPAVAQAAVIAMPDDKWGERVHAVVILRPGEAAAAEELTAHCRATLAGYKVPRSYDFVDTLPLSGAGKVLKNVLRDAARARQEAELAARAAVVG